MYDIFNYKCVFYAIPEFKLDFVVVYENITAGDNATLSNNTTPIVTPKALIDEDDDDLRLQVIIPSKYIFI